MCSKHTLFASKLLLCIWRQRQKVKNVFKVLPNSWSQSQRQYLASHPLFPLFLFLSEMRLWFFEDSDDLLCNKWNRIQSSLFNYFCNSSCFLLLLFWEESKLINALCPKPFLQWKTLDSSGKWIFWHKSTLQIIFKVLLSSVSNKKLFYGKLWGFSV